MRRLSLVVAVFGSVLAVACDQGGNASSPTAPSAAAALAAKPGPSLDLPGAITFSDRGGDAITSDGGGTYVNGGQLEVLFYDQSKDLVMKGRGRTFNVNYSNRINGTGPVGTTVADGFIFMNIHNIRGMATGTSKTALATFDTSVGTFQFGGQNYPGATLVFVSRDSSGTWMVTADTSAGTDRAALIRTHGNQQILLGIYGMPFQLSAVCPTCS